MDSITITAALMLLILVTPALLLIFIFRLFYPKTRTIPSSDAKTLLICCILNLFINGILVESFVQEQVASKNTEILSQKYQPLVKDLFVREAGVKPFRPTNFLADYFGVFDYPDKNFWGLVLDLHLRTILIGLIVLFFFRQVGIVEEVLQAIPYYREEDVRWYHKWISKFFGYDYQKMSKTNYEQERIAIRIFGWEPTKALRDAIYHPWAFLTRTNRRREILMADVLTTEGSLYSGALSSWIPTDQNVSEIVLEYALRYCPEMVEMDDSKKSGGESRKRKVRKVFFIKNNGEMAIPRERIETLHFWEIRRGHQVGVSIRRANDLEKLKWYFVIAFVYPGFIRRISILVETNAVEWTEIRKALSTWLEESGIKFKKKDIVIDIADSSV